MQCEKGSIVLENLWEGQKRRGEKQGAVLEVIRTLDPCMGFKGNWISLQCLLISQECCCLVSLEMDQILAEKSARYSSAFPYLHPTVLSLLYIQQCCLSVYCGFRSMHGMCICCLDLGVCCIPGSWISVFAVFLKFRCKQMITCSSGGVSDH